MREDDKITFLEATLFGLSGGNPSQAIENQERRGQQEVVRNQRLPKMTNHLCGVPTDILRNGVTTGMSWDDRFVIEKANNIEYTKQQYEKMGIVIVDEYDDLFWNVKLPDGWTIKATDHTMWNDLFDDKGRKRGQFFYKAAFYDRDAFINFNTRYSIAVEHTVDSSVEDFDTWYNSDWQGIVKDGDEVIYRTMTIPKAEDYMKDSANRNVLQNLLEVHMDTFYPNYEDIHAYWD